MHNPFHLPLTTTLFLLLFPTTTLSSSTTHTQSKSFSLQVTQKTDSSRDFIRDWAAAHQRWGKGVPKEVVTMLGLKETDGQVDVQPLGSDDLYIANIHVGNPPQLVKLALDTGSADLWMQTSDTIYRVNQEGPWAPKFHVDKSNTSVLIKDTVWDVSYMDGTTATGIVYTDTIRLGNLTIHNTTVQSAQIIATRFEQETALSGIMGLAKNLPSNIFPPSSSLSSGFLSHLRPHLDRPVFTVDLRRNATGRFEFGRIDDSIPIQGHPISWVDSDPNSAHWDVPFALTAWDGRDKTWWFHEFNATIDTGTTLMFLPDVLANMYWFTVPGMRIDPRLSNAYVFPCEFANNLPDLMFKIASTEQVLTIPGPYLNYGPVIGDEKYCWGGMQSASGLGDVTIIGGTMLRALFVVFDLETGKVGFVNKKLDVDTDSI